MLTLYSYPTLFGVADNNAYGLKVYAFLRLAGVPFTHEHIFDASKVPRGQLPYIVDDGETVGDSETIIAYVTRKYGVTLDAALTAVQRATNLMVTRMLDDLYWVMSYSALEGRALLAGVPRDTDSARASESHRRGPRRRRRSTTPSATTSRASAAISRTPRWRVVSPTSRCSPISSLRARNSSHSDAPTSIDAGIYGFIANIHFYEIETPLKQFVDTHDNMVRHCRAIHAKASGS